MHSGEPLQAFGKTKRCPLHRKGEVGMGKGREEPERRPHPLGARGGKLHPFKIQDPQTNVVHVSR